MRHHLLSLLIISFAISGCTREQEKSADNPTLGEIQHRFDIEDAALTSFNKGLLLLHSFEYEDAREAFIEARTASPDEMMAYWGEAMTHYRALWGLQDVEAGREVLARVGPDREKRLARVEDPLERDFWEGVEILYGEGERAERNAAYSQHMANLYERYENNQEVAAFYALSLMWTETQERDDEIYNKSAEVAAGILKENPDHPGALHYVIHAYDDPEYAKLAEEAANKYAGVAPDATHALHMPSHIYLAMGMWNDVVASNETSYAASVNRMKRKGLGDEARGYHSYAWLHYAYLQQHRFEKASALLKDMYEYEASAGTASARSYLIMMQAFQKVETGSLADREEAADVRYDDLSLSSKANAHFLRGLMAFDREDATLIEPEIDTLEIHISAAELIVSDEGIALCSAGPARYAPNKNEIIRAKVMLTELKALQAQLNGDLGSTEELLQTAVGMENQLGPPVGPPDIPYPSFEMYGNWLNKQGRYEEALAQYENSLKRAPNRRMALTGKMEALTALGRNEEAKQVEELLASFRPGAEIS